MHKRQQPEPVVGLPDHAAWSLSESGSLILDIGERRLQGVEMPPLLSGEFKLLSYLGSRPGIWHSSYELSVQVYQRDDAAGRQLVWKYASMLRKKLAGALPILIELCRRRGYCCREPIVAMDSEQLSELVRRPRA